MGVCLTLFVINMIKEELGELSMYICPLLLTLDFSLRFFLKSSLTGGIFPYLCLPIRRRILFLYMIFSELLSVGIWGCLLIYGLFIYQSGALTLTTGITFFFLLLLNNYLVALVYALTTRFVWLLFPFALALNILIGLLVWISGSPYILFLSFSALCLVVTALYFALRQGLYKELNRVSL